MPWDAWLTLSRLSHFSVFTTGGAQHGWGLGVLPPATAVTSVSLAPGGSHPAAVSGVIWSGGATPITYASAPFMATQSPAATLPVQSFPPMTAAPQFPPNMNPAGLGVCLSPGSEPVPQKLVDKVLSGAYVDMKELLGDNISLLSQLESLNIAQTLPALPGSMKPRLREVSSLASWLYCFLAYAALRCPDKESRDRLVYARLVIREAQRHGGQGWLAYDRVFRQQAALDPSFQWNVLHPAIQASTLFAPDSQSLSAHGGTFCSICRGVDHRADYCALAYLKQPTSSLSTPPRPIRRRAAVASHSLCISWNRGKCAYPSSCTYRHVCTVCFQQHPAVNCPNKFSRGPSLQPTPSAGPGGRS